MRENVTYLFVDISINACLQILVARKYGRNISAKLLGIHINTDLIFQNQVCILCRSAGRKISVIARIAKYLSVSTRKFCMKTLFESLFDYCPLIWMFSGRTTNKNINTLHERAAMVIPLVLMLLLIQIPP